MDIDPKDYDKFMRDGKTLRCQAQVAERWSNFPRYYQCNRSAKHGSFCKQHDPESVKARQEKSDKLEEQKWQERRYEIHGPSFYNALKQIAEGHNDPRTLAKELLDKFHSK